MNKPVSMGAQEGSALAGAEAISHMATLDSLKQALRRKATASSSSPRHPLSDAQYSAGFDLLVRDFRSESEFTIPQLTQLLAPLFASSQTPISVLEVGPGPRSILGWLPEKLRCKIGRYAAFEPNGLFATRLERWLGYARGGSIITSGSEKGETETETESPPRWLPFPCLDSPPDIRRIPFGLDTDDDDTTTEREEKSAEGDDYATDEKYDLVLFCHSMYAHRKAKPNKRRIIIERALGMLRAVDRRPEESRCIPPGMVVVFHRDDGALDRYLGGGGLVCHRKASFPTGAVWVAGDNETLDRFASVIAGFVVQDEAVRAEWREVCRALGRCSPEVMEGADEELFPITYQYMFSAPDIMVAFTKNATMTLSELTADVPLVEGGDERRVIKNREARLHQPAASIVRPTEIRHVQKCVLWALKHGVGLTVVGGSHSGHCLQPHVVAVDMGSFDQVHILKAGAEDDDGGDEDGDRREADPGDSLIVAEAGCKTGDIVSKAMAKGLTVPLGARPSVGAGLWLQGGIGHLSRLHGLACDAIVGAVVVSVASGDVLCVGRVPDQHRPADAIAPEDEADLLWALKGAGSNFGIVISITFKAYAAPAFYTARNWVTPLRDLDMAISKLWELEGSFADGIPRHCSTDAYLYRDGDANQLHLGVTLFEASITDASSGGSDEPTYYEPVPEMISSAWGPGEDFKVVDGVGLFDTEMYMSSMMHSGGHGGGKTSSFKRCIFIPTIVGYDDHLITAVETSPSPLCYLHLMHGGSGVQGGVVADVAADATAFGCRHWKFACVVTGVWPRDQDGTDAERAAVRWVYAVATDLLFGGNSTGRTYNDNTTFGAYGTDLGPDPRDAPLAAQAFGPNRSRLARLKRRWDPRNVLAYACPLPRPEEVPLKPRPGLIILVTGKSGVGKDHCADVWRNIICGRNRNSNSNSNSNSKNRDPLVARTASISDATKREYAEAIGQGWHLRLPWTRIFKEDHRSRVTAFFQEQVRKRPRLPEEHFEKVVHDSGTVEDVDVLLITGMRDEAPVATFSHLKPDSRVIEVRVKSSEETRRVRRGFESEGDGNGDVGGNKDKDNEDTKDEDRNDDDKSDLKGTKEDYRPCLIFDNNATGDEAAELFAERHLLPFFHPDLQRLADMVCSVPDFPRQGIEFRHVLGIPQQRGGLKLCTSLLQARFTGHWKKVSGIVCCEAGGPIFAAPLALRVDVPLVLIREASKLPPPTISVAKPASHVSSSSSMESVSDSKGEKAKEKEKENEKGGKRIEMERDTIARGTSVVVVDDVLATGETLCAVLQLLEQAGISAEDVTIMVVAEFPVHRGRDLLRRRGFERAKVQSLLVFGGA